MTKTKDQKMRERFKKKFLVGGVDSSVQFKEEVRGRLPQEFLKFLNEEIAKAREELIRDFRAELKASLCQQREEIKKKVHGQIITSFSDINGYSCPTCIKESGTERYNQAIYDIINLLEK